MTIDLPYESFRFPLVRLLTRAEWCDAGSSNPAVSGSDWQVRPMQRRAAKTHGFYLIDLERMALPMIGRARLCYRFGRFDDGLVGGDSTAGETWDPDTNTLDNVPDLTGNVIRIQVAERPEAGSQPEWTTVWLGYCDYSEDTGWPGAEIPAGERVFHCSELHARAQRWPLDRHGYQVTTSAGAVTRSNLRGHPGYNVSPYRDSRAAGNRGLSQYTINGASVYYHTDTGVTAWTDEQAVEHALAATRGPRDPLLTLTDTGSLLNSANAWEVKRGETALDFLVRVCRRERGRGCAFLTWTEASAIGAVTASLTVRAQLNDDLDNPYPGGTESFSGSDDTTSVNLIGDHRLVAEAFRLSTPDQWHYHSLETVGEQIQVVATLAYIDGYSAADGTGYAIERRWSDDDQTDFAATTGLLQRAASRYAPTYQLHGLRRGWDGLCGNGNASSSAYVDFRCNDVGSLVASTSGDAYTAPDLVEIMDDLPMYAGYQYNQEPPTRWDGASETGDLPRLSPRVMVRVSSDRYLFADTGEVPFPLQFHKADHQSFWIRCPSANPEQRIVSDTTADYGALYDLNQLVVTVGLKMPHRVRMASYADGYTESTALRRATIYQPNAHLWVCDNKAIVDLTTTSGTYSTGHVPIRPDPNPGTGSFVFRDDRAALSDLHTLATAWYLRERRTVTWALRACGLFSSFELRDGSSQAYPRIGQLITTLSANGETQTIDTPVVSIRYDHDSGVTTFSTGWSELDIQ